jgi:5-methylcytosine-specific restriction endonuclease McrA
LSYRMKMWIKQHYRCGICGKTIRRPILYDSKKVNIDHIRPRSHGGPSTPENLQLVHYECNQAKGATCAGCEECSYY